MTTNYDTLLERASQAVDRSYEPVTSAADLARTRAPRIVKLHGSIDKGGPLILAAEDYRAYPQTHGAFVNFARQAFIENDLCLLGFSGDDPNFLAWAGWVRDHLGDSARRIYLIGALELSAPKRRYLVAQNIIPIDFHPLVAHLDKDQRHEAATNKFLQYLRDLRPKVSHEWQPGECPVTPTPDAKTIEEQVENLRACVNQWRLDRESYPGWLICPHSQRRAIRSATSNAPMSLPVLQALPPEEIIGFFSELIWRHRTALWPLDPVIASWIGDLADPEAMPQTSQQAQADLALALLNHARLEGDEASFERLARFIKCLPSFAGEMKAERALALWNFVTATSDNAGLGALTSFTAKFSEWRSRLSGQILKGFLSSDSRTIRNSYHAIQQWVGAPRAIRRVLPPAIIDRLVMMIEVQTDSEMAMLLDTMRQVVAHKMLQLEQQNRLEAALEDLLNMAQYNLVNPKSKLAVDISLVRCEAVRLCRAMREQGNSALIIDAWLREGSEDILPEVRYCR